MPASSAAAQAFSKAETHVTGETVETALLLTAVRFGRPPRDFTPETEIPFDPTECA
jgi:hypothetical protein